MDKIYLPSMSDLSNKSAKRIEILEAVFKN